jgi:hypothetical protein
MTYSEKSQVPVPHSINRDVSNLQPESPTQYESSLSAANSDRRPRYLHEPLSITLRVPEPFSHEDDHTALRGKNAARFNERESNTGHEDSSPDFDHLSPLSNAMRTGNGVVS